MEDQDSFSTLAEENTVEQLDFRALPLVYSAPGMSQVTRLSDITYKTLDDGTELKMDAHYPAFYDGQTLLPAVIFVHGDAAPDMLRTAKDWASYVSWGQLAACFGLIGVTFNHRSTELFQKVYESAADVDDLINYVRLHSHDLGIDPERLGIWTCSAGAYRGLRAALRGSPAYIRCAVSYYGVADLKVFYAKSTASKNLTNAQQEVALPQLSDETFREFAVATYLSQETAIPPLLIVRAGLDDSDLNAALDALLPIALARNLDVTFINHASGHHAFDSLDDNERSREIIRATLEFIKAHLSRENEEE